MHFLHRMRLGRVQLSIGAQLPLLEQPAPMRLADARLRGTRFLEVTSRSVLNGPASTHMEFWSINPYVGCEFGCSYCYARDTHRWTVERAGGLEGSGDDASLAFERNILVKQNAARVLERTLDPARIGSVTIIIGTATDPYQPGERKFGITRSILDAFRRYRGLSLGIITKSPLIIRDLDLLMELSLQHRLRANISLATTDPTLARRLEARSPVPSARLRALARLRAAGLEAGLLVAPVIPGITDSRPSLARLFAAARRADASFITCAPLRLGPAARATFLPRLEKEFPQLVSRYRLHYARRDHASQAYRDALTSRVNALRSAYGFPPTPSVGDEPELSAPISDKQLNLL
jgi:DNA repair photolyase